MRKILTSLIIIILLPWIATADDLKEAQKHVRNLNEAVNVTLDRVDGLESNTKKHITNLDTAVNALTDRVEKVEQKEDDGKDVTSRMVLYRLLVSNFSAAIRLQDQKNPVFSEQAFWDGIKDNKAKSYLKKTLKGNCLPQMYAEAGMIYPTMLGDWLAAADEILYALQPQEQERIDVRSLKNEVKTSVLSEVKPVADGAKKVADSALAQAKQAMERATEAGNAAVGAAAIANGKADKVDLEASRDELADLASKAEVNELRSYVLDSEGNLKLAKTETVETVFCTLDGRITPLEAGAKRIEARVSALETAATYLSQKKWDEAKGAMFIHYGRGGLRALGWSEKEIDKAEKVAGKLSPKPVETETEAPQPEEGGAETEQLEY